MSLQEDHRRAMADPCLLNLAKIMSTRCNNCDEYTELLYVVEHSGMCPDCFKQYEAEMDAWADERYKDTADYEEQMQERGE